MSSEDRPEFLALDELREVLNTLTGELASWRRRALKAESEQAHLPFDQEAVATRERLVALESENSDLTERLEFAKQRVTELMQRLRFLEEQVATEEQSR